MSSTRQSLFTMADGKDLVVTFSLVSSLFLLWGICNGMFGVMDKHFQDELGSSKSQSAWVQFAHYLGSLLVALPAVWLATRINQPCNGVGSTCSRDWRRPANHAVLN